MSYQCSIWEDEENKHETSTLCNGANVKALCVRTCSIQEKKCLSRKRLNYFAEVCSLANSRSSQQQSSMLPKMVQVVEASEPEKEVDDMHNDKQNEGAAHVMDY